MALGIGGAISRATGNIGSGGMFGGAFGRATSGLTGMGMSPGSANSMFGGAFRQFNKKIRPNAPTNQEPNPLSLNIYEQYPGFNPLMRGDQLGGMEKQRGGSPETLQRLSDATMRFRGMGPGQPRGMGMGFGDTDPIKKLLMARYGGGI